LDGFFISFLRSEPDTQLVLLLINAAGMMVAYWSINPFLRETDYQLFTAMQLLRVILLLISIGFVVNGADADTLGVAVIVIHILVCCLFVLIRLYDLYQKVRIACAPTTNEKPRDSNVAALAMAGVHIDTGAATSASPPSGTSSTPTIGVGSGAGTGAAVQMTSITPIIPASPSSVASTAGLTPLVNGSATANTDASTTGKLSVTSEHISFC
jgi:hypothetical protein